MFAKQLQGEAGPTTEQMSHLVKAAAALLKEAPWEHGLGDREMIAVDTRDGRERCYCVFLGINGEIFGMKAYIGDQGLASYRWLMKKHESAGVDYLARLHAVSVEFVAAGELKPADRQAIAAAWRSAKGRRPQFRTWRPGYFPWFPNEQETAWLTDCIEAVLVFLPALRSKSGALWPSDESLPLMEWRDGVWQQQNTILLPRTDAPVETPVAPGSREVEVRRRFPRTGILETTHLYLGASVGKAHERKALLCAVLVVDAATGVVFQPELAASDRSAGDMLNHAILNAIDRRGARPAEVHVSDPRVRDLLEPVAHALGFRVKLVRAMPALDDAVAGLMNFLETG
jgi:hypothetical protein